MLGPDRMWSLGGCRGTAAALLSVTLVVACDGPTEPKPSQTPEVSGRVTDGTAVSPARLQAVGSAGTSSLSTDGSFRVPVLDSAARQIIYINRDGDGLAMALLLLPGDTSSVVDARSTLEALVLTHPALAGANVDDLRLVRSRLTSAASWSSVLAQTRERINKGQDLLPDKAFWSQADNILLELVAPSNEAAQHQVASERNEPTITHTAPGQWTVINPRPIYFGFETRPLTGDRTFSLVRRADYKWQFALEFYVREPTSTLHIIPLGQGPFDAILTRGLWFEEFLSEVNATPLAWNVALIMARGLETLGISLSDTAPCIANALLRAGPPALEAAEAIFNGVSIEAIDLALLAGNVFDVAKACFPAGVEEDWVVKAFESFSKYLNLFGRTRAAYELGQMLAAMVDPLVAERLAGLEAGPHSRITTDAGVSLSSDPTGAQAWIDNVAHGQTPVRAFIPSIGTHSYLLTRTSTNLRK